MLLLKLEIGHSKMLKGEFQLLRQHWYARCHKYFFEADFEDFYEDPSDGDCDE